MLKLIPLTLFTLSACTIDDDELAESAAAQSQPCTHFVSKEKQALDAAGHGTSAMPWRTINYAVNHVGPGATVCVRPASYPELVQPTISGTATAPISVIKWGTGDAVIDGTITTIGFGACPPTIGIYGRSHLRFSGFTITNRGNAGYPGADVQPCQTSGMLITPSNIGESVEDIIVANNRFAGIRTPFGSQIGLPLGFGSYRTDASVHHIQIDGNTFTDNDTIAEDRRDGTGNVSPIWVSAVGVVGDAHDWLVRKNTFDDADTGGVELAGNQGNNLQPANGVVTDNVFIRSGNDAQFGGAGVYNQGGHHILVERNFFDQTGYGVSVHTEPTYDTKGNCIAPLPAGHTVVRNNIMVNTKWNDFRTGANHNQTSCNYGDVDSVYFTNNTIFRSSSLTEPSILIVRNPTAGLVGQNRFLDNIIMTTSRVFAIYGAAPPMTSNFNYVGAPMVRPVLRDGLEMTWAEWTAIQDQSSRFDSFWMSTIFVVGWPAARNDFALSATITPPHNGGVPNPPFGEPTTPAWATFGAFTPSAQLDHYGGPRDVAIRRDIGADER